MIDCGLYQEWKLKSRNWEPFPIPPSSVDAVLLTHAHLDHCGRLPKLVKDGFQGKIHCTAASGELAKIVLLDSAHLQEEDAAFKEKRHKREGRKDKAPVQPLYTTEDAENTVPLFSPVNYETSVDVAPGIQAVFFEAGHILGSSMIGVKVKQDGQTRNILFSGDAGRWDRPIIEDPTLFHSADYVVVESTYGDRMHDHSGGDVEDQLTQIINETRAAGGNIVIPSFAIERSQEILYHLSELLINKRIQEILVFLDSPMAVKVTEVFKNHPELYDEEMRKLIEEGNSPFDFPGLVMVKTVEQSKAINHIKGSTIIIAGSGMVTGGRIKHHLVTNITRPESTILFVGYQAQGTLGRHILEGASEVRILGETYPVRARIAQIGGFSAHADRAELSRWLSSLEIPPRRVFITHGEEEAAKSFGDYLKGATGWDVHVPEYKERVILD